MLKRVAVVVVILLSLSLQGCVSGGAGLKAYVDSIDGYEFLYPNGWIPAQVSGGPDVVFRDLIQRTENVSVVVSPVATQMSLADLGSPSEVGQQLAQKVIAPPNSGRNAELMSATERHLGPKTYYDFEYEIQLGDQQRHNLASVAVSRGKLYTLSVSAAEERWSQVKNLFKQVINSFAVY